MYICLLTLSETERGRGDGRGHKAVSDASFSPAVLPVGGACLASTESLSGTVVVAEVGGREAEGSVLADAPKSMDLKCVTSALYTSSVRSTLVPPGSLRWTST